MRPSRNHQFSLEDKHLIQHATDRETQTTEDTTWAECLRHQRFLINCLAALVRSQPASSDVSNIRSDDHWEAKVMQDYWLQQQQQQNWLRSKYKSYVSLFQDQDRQQFQQQRAKKWQYADALQLCISRKCPGSRGPMFYNCVLKYCVPAAS